MNGVQQDVAHLARQVCARHTEQSSMRCVQVPLNVCDAIGGAQAAGQTTPGQRHLDERNVRAGCMVVRRVGRADARACMFRVHEYGARGRCMNRLAHRVMMMGCLVAAAHDHRSRRCGCTRRADTGRFLGMPVAPRQRQFGARKDHYRGCVQHQRDMTRQWAHGKTGVVAHGAPNKDQAVVVSNATMACWLHACHCVCVWAALTLLQKHDFVTVHDTECVTGDELHRTHCSRAPPVSGLALVLVQLAVWRRLLRPGRQTSPA